MSFKTLHILHEDSILLGFVIELEWIKELWLGALVFAAIHCCNLQPWSENSLHLAIHGHYEAYLLKSVGA